MNSQTCADSDDDGDESDPEMDAWIQGPNHNTIFCYCRCLLLLPLFIVISYAAILETKYSGSIMIVICTSICFHTMNQKIEVHFFCDILHLNKYFR